MKPSTIVFVHVNKCGGKSLDIALREYAAMHGIAYHEVHGLVGAPATKATSVSWVLFVRDPIERFISAFKFAHTRRFLLGYHDINALVDAMRTNDALRQRMFEINEHFAYTLERYVGRSNKIPWTFVGTTESIREDYTQLLNTLDTKYGVRNNHPRPILGHYHRSQRSKPNSNKCKVLSRENVTYLRDQLYKGDYLCIASLVEQGYLPQSYLDDVTTRVHYTY